MEEKIIQGPCTFEFKAAPTCEIPFRGSGMGNIYFQEGPFNYDILEYCGGTSGAPAVSSYNKTAAFLTDKGGRIINDGKNVKIVIEKGQKLLYMDDDRSEREKWMAYKNLVELPEVKTPTRQAFWLLPEYVTWVEQKYSAGKAKLKPRDVLNEEFVLEYMDRIEKLGYPKGKLTIDDGWQETFGDAEWTDGYWRVDKTKFPDMKRMCDEIKEHGFVPSIWMGIPSVPVGASILEDHPELFDEELKLGGGTYDRYYYKPSELLTKHFKDVISPLAEMGFRKFKFDFFYGPRGRMRGIMKCLHDAVRSIDETIEIESHHSDPFFSCYCDVFRMNDVIPVPGYDWRGLTLSHIRLANYIATDCIINLDHAGGNYPFINEEDFIENLRLFDFVYDKPRYAVVSLLPDRFSEKARMALAEHISKNTVRL